MPTQLTQTDLAYLTFERENTFWQHAGNYESAILDRFGISMTTYLRRLYRLIKRPEAQAHDPVTTRRLLARVESSRVRRV